MWYILGRFIQVGFAFFLSCVLAVILLTVLGGQELARLSLENIQDVDADFIVLHDVFISFLFFTAISPALTFGPALVFVIVGEVARITSYFYYVITGGISVLALLFLFEPENAASFAMPSPRFMTIFAATGFIAGFVYWLLAGRKA
ncbi:MAG: hypothetical protein AAF228_06910 [Pseudomonadota bacterium]